MVAQRTIKAPTEQQQYERNRNFTKEPNYLDTEEPWIVACDDYGAPCKYASKNTREVLRKLIIRLSLNRHCYVGRSERELATRVLEISQVTLARALPDLQTLGMIKYCTIAGQFVLKVEIKRIWEENDRYLMKFPRGIEYTYLAPEIVDFLGADTLTPCKSSVTSSEQSVTPRFISVTNDEQSVTVACSKTGHKISSKITKTEEDEGRSERAASGSSGQPSISHSCPSFSFSSSTQKDDATKEEEGPVIPESDAAGRALITQVIAMLGLPATPFLQRYLYTFYRQDPQFPLRLEAEEAKSYYARAKGEQITESWLYTSLKDKMQRYQRDAQRLRQVTSSPSPSRTATYQTPATGAAATYYPKHPTVAPANWTGPSTRRPAPSREVHA